jgi:hypothetical protein
MRRLMLLAFGAVLLMASSGPGQFSWYHEGHGSRPEAADQLVRSWYLRFLHRPAGNGEELGWVQALESGQPADQILSGILGSTEYYNNAGGTPDRFVGRLFTDLNGRPPSREEMEFWVRRLHIANPNDVAFEMLTRYPQHWGEEPYFPDEHRYDIRRPNLLPYRK